MLLLLLLLLPMMWRDVACMLLHLIMPETSGGVATETGIYVFINTISSINRRGLPVAVVPWGSRLSFCTGHNLIVEHMGPWSCCLFS